MADAVEVFKNNMVEAERLRGEQREAEARQAEQRKADMRELADAFEGAVGEIVETVSSAATELEASATTLTRRPNDRRRWRPPSPRLPRKPPPTCNRYLRPARN